MKTITQYIYNYIQEKNIKKEYILYEERLIEGIELYVKERNMEKHLEKYSDDKKEKIMNMKLKAFENYSFHYLLFYFCNYHQVSQMLLCHSVIQDYLRHNKTIEQEAADNIYQKYMQAVKDCVYKEYFDIQIDDDIYQIKKELKDICQNKIF